MSVAEFKVILDRTVNPVRHAKLFQFTTFEPALHKDLFKLFDLVLAVNPKIRFPYLTNAMLLDSAYLEKLRKYPISDFAVSLDGMNDKTVESFKNGADFRHIVDIIRKFNKMDFGFPAQTVFVLTKNNYLELPAYVDFMNDLGVKTIYVNNLLAFNQETKDLPIYSTEINHEIEDLFTETKNKVIKNKQTIYLPSMIPLEIGCKSCELLFIDINGNIAPCDYLAVDTTFNYFEKSNTIDPVIFGNIFDKPVMDIYRSKETKNFRKMHRNGNIPDACSCCINAYGLLCSNREKVSGS
jgi:MoaA/NifB/PqqE/SkfB family radical SAM enzyme